MSPPRWATTVAPFSKILALIIFISFPILGTYLGYKYGKITSTTDTTESHKTKAILSNWGTYTNDKNKVSINYPPDTKAIIETDPSTISNEWRLLLTNQKNYPDKLEKRLYGKGLYFIQIRITNSANYDYPGKGKINITEENFNALFGKEKSEKGLIRSRPTIKIKDVTYPKLGSVNYVIYDYNRIIFIYASSDNTDVTPFTTLDKIVSSFQLL